MAIAKQELEAIRVTTIGDRQALIICDYSAEEWTSDVAEAVDIEAALLLASGEDYSLLKDGVDCVEKPLGIINLSDTEGESDCLNVKIWQECFPGFASALQEFLNDASNEHPKLELEEQDLHGLLDLPPPPDLSQLSSSSPFNSLVLRESPIQLFDSEQVCFDLDGNDAEFVIFVGHRDHKDETQGFYILTDDRMEHSIGHQNLFLDRLSELSLRVDPEIDALLDEFAEQLDELPSDGCFLQMHFKPEAKDGRRTTGACLLAGLVLARLESLFPGKFNSKANESGLIVTNFGSRRVDSLVREIILRSYEIVRRDQ